MIRLITAINSHNIQRILIVCLLLTFMAPTTLSANDLTDPIQIMIRQHHAETVMQGDTLMNVSGAVGVNMASGDSNQQSNSGAIALGGSAHAQNLIMQKSSIADGFTPDKASTTIQGQAFSNATGWMAVNQAAGQGNAQINGMAIAVGTAGRTLTDNNLSQILSGQQVLTVDQADTGDSERLVEIDSTAFSGARGIMQVNQSAGTGNATSNSFELRIGVRTGQ